MTDRRTFLASTLALAGTAATTSHGMGSRPRRIKAVAFDGLAVFDPRPIGAAVEKRFPGRGAEIMATWRTRQFEYTWLRTLMGRYADFRQVTEEALAFTVAHHKLDWPEAERAALMQQFAEIKAWPDVADVLARLKIDGCRCALLSNFTAPMLDAATRNSGLAGHFEPHLSTDLVRAFKPHPRAYHLALEAFGLPREQIAFVAFGGWDAAGAKAFGFPTYWANRAGAATEVLGFGPDMVAPDLRALPQFLRLPQW